MCCPTLSEASVRFGGEYRRAQLEEFYHRHGLGILSLMAQWDREGRLSDSKVKAWPISCRRLQPNHFNHRARNPTRLVYVRPRSVFSGRLAVFSQLTFNYGVRWDYEGPLGDSKKDLSVFIPSRRLVFQGAGISHVIRQGTRTSRRG